jgi:hypothetical protein
MNLTTKDTKGHVLNLYEATPGETDVTITYNCSFSSGLWIPYHGPTLQGGLALGALCMGGHGDPFQELFYD